MSCIGCWCRWVSRVRWWRRLWCRSLLVRRSRLIVAMRGDWCGSTALVSSFRCGSRPARRKAVGTCVDCAARWCSTVVERASVSGRSCYAATSCIATGRPGRSSTGVGCGPCRSMTWAPRRRSRSCSPAWKNASCASRRSTLTPHGVLRTRPLRRRGRPTCRLSRHRPTQRARDGLGGV